MSEYKISKIDLIILKDLLKKSKIDFINSLSIYELEISKISKQSTIYKRIKYLESIGFLEKGLKNSKKDTYYITEIGISKVNEI